MKYTVAFGWLAIDNGSHNNQPKKRRSMEGRCDKREACGKFDTIVVTKIEQQRKKKKKYTMALNNNNNNNNLLHYHKGLSAIGFESAYRFIGLATLFISCVAS